MVTKTRLRAKMTPHAQTLSGIAHVTRLSLLFLLAQGSKDTWELAENIGQSEPLVVHHLQKLRGSGWVTRLQIGRKVTYTINPRAAENIKKLFAQTSEGKDLF